MKSYFISDIHLENMQERNGQTLLRFLHFLNSQTQVPDLYLLGDIFDFWLSDHKIFTSKFEPLYAPLRELKKKGARLVYFEGNHDLHLHPFWQNELGFEIHTQAEYRQIGDFNVRLEHGDLMNPNDTHYLRWRAFSRNKIVEGFAHHLPGSFWDWIGEKMSSASRKKSRHYRARNEEPIKQLIRVHAEKVYQEKPFDILISGHMHVKLDESVGPYRNINLGSWLEDGPPEVLVIEDNQIRWEKVG